MALEHIFSVEIIPSRIFVWENKVVRTIFSEPIEIPDKVNLYRLQSKNVLFYRSIDLFNSKRINPIPEDAEIICADYHEVYINGQTIYVEYCKPRFFQKKDFNKLDCLRN